MARDLSIDLEVNPILDTRATKNLVSTLEKELRSVKSGQHLPLARRASSVMRGLMDSGVATTSTQARIILADMMGGGFSSQQKAVLRSAQNITSAQLFLEKTNRIQQQRISAVAARAATLSNQYQVFEQSPTAQGATALLVGLTGIRRELLKLYQEYRVNRRQVPQILRQIAQNTSSMKREVSDWGTPTDNVSSSGASGALDFTRKLTGIAAGVSGVVSVLKKGWQAIQSSLGRGMQALRLEAAYGRSVDWGDVRARAGLFNMSTEAAASTSEYAADFRQRMMWGEISEREIIGLSRAGRWGRMIMSGEAARNPALANQAFEEMVANTEPAKMRSILRQLGLSQELMGYRVQAYDTTTRQEYEDRFRIMASSELDVAKMMYDAGNQMQVALEEASTALSVFAGEAVQSLSPQGRAAYERLRGAGIEDTTKTAMSREYTRIRERYGIDRGILGDNFWSNKMVSPQSVSQTVNNNVTINGNVDMDNIDSITERMSAELAKSNYDMAANAIGARTSF